MSVTERELDRRLDALTRRSDAPEALWSAIERRLARRRPWMAPAAAAAAVCLAVLAGLLVTDDSLQPPDRSVMEPPILETMARAEMGVMRRSAPDQVAALLEAGGPGLMQGWAVNQAAIGDLETALDARPGNRDLLDQLARARLRQSGLVNRML